MCELQRIVGFKKEIRGGLVFSGKSTLFYISGQIGIYHILKENVQKFFPITEKNEFTAMALSGKNLLALASKGLVPKLTVYNLKSSDKIILPNSNFNSITEYVYVAFSDDDEHIAAQGGIPSCSFLRWDLAKKSLLGVYFPFRLEPGAKALKFSFNPRDQNNVVTFGRFFFRIYNFRNGNRFKEEAWHNLERSQKIFHSLTWLQTEKFAVGTSDGNILIFEKKQLIQKIHLDEKLAEVPRIFNKIGNPEDKNVTFILSTKTGIICSYGGDSVLCLHWKIDKKDFNVVASIHIPQHVECFTEDSKIVQLALNSNEDILAAATDNGQILSFFFKVPGLLESIGYETDFDVILDQQHKTPIICADTAINSPVHVTCSVRTLILWNYQKRQLLLWKRFNKNICSVSIHPLGINLLIGFNENCKVYNILNDKLEEIREFNSKSYSQVKFSGGGHMLALSSKDFIELYSNLSFEKITQFDNEDEIKCLLWKDNDHHLLSLNKPGKIYELDIVQKKKVWSFSSNAERFLTLAFFNNCIYAGTSDKIWIFCNYTKTGEIETHIKATSILVTEHMLLSGYENGVVCGFQQPFEPQHKLFETYCHKGSIINMTTKENGKLLMVTGENGAISMWKINYQSDNPIPLFDEVLIEQELYDSNIDTIFHLEKELEAKTKAAERRKDEQLQSQEKEIKQIKAHYEDIQNQLKQTMMVLSEEKYNLQIDIEKRKLEQVEALCKERDENFADFQTKIEKEKENFERLTEERLTKVEDYEWQLFNVKEEIKASNEKVQAVREEYENRLKELELMLQIEFDARQETTKQNEEFYRNLEKKAKAKSEEINFKFASDLEKARKENQLLTTEVQRKSAILNYAKECRRTLDAEFGKKKRIYDGLKKITKHIKNSIVEIRKDIQRTESVIEERIAMIKLLEEDSKETAHMNSEANWRIEEYKKKLEKKSEELVQLSAELEELETEQENLTRKLKLQKRDQLMNEEKLKATERSIAESTQKILKAQMQLERNRKEFIDATKNVESPFALRTALLKLLDTMVLRKSITEDVFTGDMDPYIKFCRQRDHYELLINTVLNRKQEIQASFRNTYVNLAKENSDWTAFAEALRRDVKQKQDKIQVLEKCMNMNAKNFSKDPTETQRRFNNVYEKLKRLEKEEDDEIQKRIDLIEKQTTELQRLHGVFVVEERAKIVRKIGH